MADKMVGIQVRTLDREGNELSSFLVRTNDDGIAFDHVDFRQFFRAVDGVPTRLDVDWEYTKNGMRFYVWDKNHTIGYAEYMHKYEALED